MVQCSKCGLLAVRDRQTDKPVEVTLYSRQEGLQKTIKSECLAKVFCYKDKRQFDWSQANNGGPVVREINEHIECADYLPWQPGKTPQQHEEMSLLEQVRTETAQNRAEDLRLRQQFETKYLRLTAATAVISLLALLVAILVAIFK